MIDINLSAFFSNQSLCIMKEVLGMRLSGHATMLSFQTQQEQTVFIQQELGKAVARVQKKNVQAKGQFACTPNLKLSTEKLE